MHEIILFAFQANKNTKIILLNRADCAKRRLNDVRLEALAKGLKALAQAFKVRVLHPGIRSIFHPCKIINALARMTAPARKIIMADAENSPFWTTPIFSDFSPFKGVCTIKKLLIIKIYNIGHFFYQRIVMALGPLDIEVKVDSKREILSETDTTGKIVYINDYFVELSAYREEELVGAVHSIVRHPDMPKTVFKLLWDALKQGKKYTAIIKNRRKDGKYYWVYSEYKPLYDKQKQIRGFRSNRYPVPRKVLGEVESLYAKLIDLEKTKGEKDAEMFLELKLHQDGFHDYAEYVEDLHQKKFKNLFGVFGRLFDRK
jgi:PAS domain S-box-containing protein